jgi:hypothetical protein
MKRTWFENRVMDLCCRAVKAEDDAEVQRLVAELRQVLHERIQQLRSKLVVMSERSSEEVREGSVSVDSDSVA